MDEKGKGNTGGVLFPIPPPPLQQIFLNAYFGFVTFLL